MTTSTNARVFVSVQEGKVEIKGSEECVRRQLAQWQEVIAQIAASKKSEESDLGTAPRSSQRKFSSLGKYAKLYNTSANGKIELLKDLSGRNMAHKTVSAALMVSYANSLLGAEQTPLELIRTT